MKSIKKNYIYNLIYQMLIILLPLITAPYISRTLGAESIGIYSYTNSVVQYFLLFAMLGIATYGNRSIAASRNNKIELNNTFWSIYSIQFITFLIVLVVYYFYFYYICKDNQNIAVLQSLFLFAGLIDISWFFFGLEEFRITVSRNFIIKLISVVCIFVFVHTSEDLWKYTLIMSSGMLFSQIYLWFFLKRHISPLNLSQVNIRIHIKPILVLFIPVISYSIYKVMDKIMLGNISDYYQVGYYESAGKLIGIPLGLVTALGTVMLPRISNLVENKKIDVINEYFNRSFKFVSIIGIAIAFGLIGISNILTQVFFGKDFVPAAPLISILSVSTLFITWASVIRSQYLIPFKKDKVYIYSTIIGASLNLVINIILIPRYQAIGACIGTVVAEFSVLFVQMIGVRKSHPIFKNFIFNIPILLIGTIMMVFVRFMSGYMSISAVSLIIQIISGGIIYIFLVSLYLIIKKDEFIKYLLDMLKERNKSKK